MRVVYGQSAAGARRVGGQANGAEITYQQNQSDQSAKPVRVTRINGERISFKQLATMAWPLKTEANLAFVTGYDPRTCRRWLADDTEPPAEALSFVLVEIMRRFHQRA